MDNLIGKRLDGRYLIGSLVGVGGMANVYRGKDMKTGRDYFDSRLGKKNGVPIYKSDSLLTGFDAGTPDVFIDYGDFYLIVSSNNTGVYEKTPPMISSIWYYTESVYSAYDYSGNLIFKFSFNSRLKIISSSSP